ncbi:MAG TPA: hypothetical protein VHU92_14820 [Streptosporangiaceae bacterium]|nr:hypothetical protein [Streptosporangiaceae bacterium]
MRCAAERPRPGWAVRAGAGAVAAGCLLAACSSPARTGSGSSPTGSAASNAIGAARRALSLRGGGGPGGGPVFVVGGPGGGFVALPAGGGSGGSGGGGRPKITVGPIPPAGSSQVISLPLDTYANVAFSQQTVLSEADTLLTQKCMTGRGFVYSIQATPSQAQTLVQSAEYPFGVTSEADAATYGYGQPSSSGPRAGPAFLGGFQTFGDLAKQARAWTVALLGFAPGARIGPHQAQGCLSEASGELYGSRGGLSDPVPQIAVQSASWTESDPRVEAVDSLWSRCMAARGYRYNTPQQAADRGWPSKPTPAETATAEADVSCKQAVNLDNTWLAVEAAYQSALIGQDLSTLAGLQGSFQGMLHRAEALLSLSSLPTEPLNLPGRHGTVNLGPTPVYIRPVG